MRLEHSLLFGMKLGRSTNLISKLSESNNSNAIVFVTQVTLAKA